MDNVKKYLNTTNNIIVTATDNGNGLTTLSTEGTGLKNVPEQIDTVEFNRYVSYGAYDLIPEPDNRVFVVLSPDHLEIHPEDSYKGLLAAKAAFTEWANRFVKQGYYSSCGGRIALDALESFCKYVPVEPKRFFIHNDYLPDLADLERGFEIPDDQLDEIRDSVEEPLNELYPGSYTEITELQYNCIMKAASEL